MTEDQIASIQYAADWLSRSEDIGNRKHGERLRALLSQSIADTAGAKAVAQSISDAMMDLVDRLGSEADSVDPRAWKHLLVYARPHMTLDKPAQVSGTRFGTGVKWSTVIGAAQRYHEFMQTPEKEALRIENARAFMESFAAPPAPSSDTAGAKARESLQLTCEQAIRLNAALESPSEPNEALKGAMEKFRAQESRERVSMTYEQFTELASKAKASNDLHMRVLALEASSYLKDEEISHLRKRIAATPAPSVADAAGASEIRALIADDAYAMSFQTMGQYRSALLNAIKKETGK